jgi:hypothetical protein
MEEEPNLPIDSTDESEEEVSGHPDISPELLRETGRASAMQDIIDKAAEFSQRGEAIEKTLIASVVAENKVFKRRNRVLVGGMSVLILLVAILLGRAFFITGPQLNNIEQMSDDVEDIAVFIRILENTACSEASLAVAPENQELCDRLAEARAQQEEEDVRP